MKITKMPATKKLNEYGEVSYNRPAVYQSNSHRIIRCLSNLQWIVQNTKYEKQAKSISYHMDWDSISFRHSNVFPNLPSEEAALEWLEAQLN